MFLLCAIYNLLNIFGMLIFLCISLTNLMRNAQFKKSFVPFFLVHIAKIDKDFIY